MEKKQKLLAERRSRIALLSSQRAAAEAALAKATAAHQSHAIDGDISDEMTGARLHSDVVSCTLRVKGFDAPLAELQAQIETLEHEIAEELAAVERKAVSEKLELDLDQIERALPKYLTAAREYADALSAISYWHFESQQMVNFVENGMAQIQLAAGFSLTELRGIVERVEAGDAPIPKPKSIDEPIAAVGPQPTQTVWMLRSARFRDHAGMMRIARQWDDAELPLEAAQRALRLGIATLVSDPRRRELKGARGGDHVDPRSPDIVDLDAIEIGKVPNVNIESNPVLAAADFHSIDRSGEARTLEITVPRS